MFEYQQKKPLKLLEYGRNIQGLAEYLLTIEDRQKRTDYAHALVELMKDMLPNYGDGEDVYNKLWDDLFIMTDFRLDVDAPFPMPDPEQLNRRPDPVPYPQKDLKYKHYGRNIERLITMAKTIEDEEERKITFAYIGSLMKMQSLSWNQDSVENAVIYQHLKEMTGTDLPFSLEEAESLGLFDNLSVRSSKNRNGNGHSNGKQNKKKRKRRS